MIENDLELSATQERIAYLLRLLAQLRVSATPEEFRPSPAGIPRRWSACSGKSSITSPAT